MINSLRRLNFRQRQSLTLLVLAIFPLLVTLGLSIPASRSFIIRQTTAQLNTVAEFKIAQINQWLDQGRDAAVLVANLPILTEEQFSTIVWNEGDQQVEAALLEVLQTIVSVNQHVRAISILHPDEGHVILSTDPTQLGREHGNEASFHQGQAALTISPVSYSIGREAPLLMISTPVQAENGALLAVAVIEMNLTDLQTALNSRAGLGETGRAYMIESNGFYATLPRGTEVGLLGTTAQSEGIDSVLAGNQDSAIYQDPRGVSVLGVYHWLSNVELGLLVEIEEAELTSEIRQIWLIAMGVGIGILGLATLGVRAMVNWLMTPLEQIVDATRSLQAGKMDRRVPESGPDEVGQLATAFNAMADSIQESYQDLEAKVAQRTAELAQANKQLREEITERTRAEDDIQRHNQELAALNAIAAAMSQSLDLEEILEAALERTLAALGVKGGILYLFDKTDQSFVPLAQRGLDKREVEEINQLGKQRGCFGTADQSGDPFIIADLSEETEDAVASTVQAGWRSLVCLPLNAKSRMVGMMLVLSHTPARFSQENLSLLTAVSNQIGVVVENVQLAQEAAEVEILRELDRLRSELIANVSHELRTPLGLIKVFCTTLLRDDMDLDAETHQEFLLDIDEETDKLEEIVDNLLNLSKMGDGRLQLDRKPTDLGQLARQVIDNLDVQLTQHDFVHDFPPTPLVASIDPKRIEQVLRNLVNNAIKYSPNGGKITVQGRGDKTQVLLWVSDQGIGIPSSELKHVFERFYRVEGFGAEEIGGVGLGLAVCQGIVEAHNGQIWAESTLGVGSTFYFALPTSVKLEQSRF